MRSLTTVPSRDWKLLPRSSAEAKAHDRLYYYSGGRCRNGHFALAKVGKGCVVCIALGEARAAVRVHERIAQRELDRNEPVRGDLRPATTEARVLVAIAERAGIITQTELADPAVRGMSRANVSAAVRSLRRRKLVEFDGRVYRVTRVGWGNAIRLGAVGARFG